MEEASRESAERVRSLLHGARLTPPVFRRELERVPASERDVWLDRVLGLDAIPEDGAALPPGCVPYLPCSVAALLAMVEAAQIGPSDVFVDVGSGVGRAAALVHLWTGAPVIGLEIQPELVRASRELAERLSLRRFSSIEGDAAHLARLVATGTVFFLYCPFSGARLDKVLDDLQSIARTRRIRVGSVDLPLPPRPRLRLRASLPDGLTVYESTPASEGRVAS